MFQVVFTSRNFNAVCSEIRRGVLGEFFFSPLKLKRKFELKSDVFFLYWEKLWKSEYGLIMTKMDNGYQFGCWLDPRSANFFFTALDVIASHALRFSTVPHKYRAPPAHFPCVLYGHPTGISFNSEVRAIRGRLCDSWQKSSALYHAGRKDPKSVTRQKGGQTSVLRSFQMQFGGHPVRAGASCGAIFLSYSRRRGGFSRFFPISTKMTNLAMLTGMKVRLNELRISSGNSSHPRTIFEFLDTHPKIAQCKN